MDRQMAILYRRRLICFLTNTLFHPMDCISDSIARNFKVLHKTINLNQRIFEHNCYYLHTDRSAQFDTGRSSYPVTKQSFVYLILPIHVPPLYTCFCLVQCGNRYHSKMVLRNSGMVTVQF